jgi:hypothetical protein
VIDGLVNENDKAVKLTSPLEVMSQESTVNLKTNVFQN